MTSTVLDKPAAPAQTTTYPPLTAQDRCEARTITPLEGEKKAPSNCGAQGYRRAVNAKGHDLVFCKHHGDKLEPTLIADGFSLTDESGKINAKPSPSANA